MIVAAIVDLEDEDDDDDEEEDNLEEIEILEALLRFYIVKRRMLLFEPDHFARRRIINIPRTLRSFPTIDIGNLFRFRCREDIRRLIDVWRLPVEENGRILVSDRGHYMFTEELFLFVLRRLSSKTTLDELARNDFRNNEYSRLSRAFNFFVRHTKTVFAEKLSNQCLSFFEPRFSRYAEAIRIKCNEAGGTEFAKGHFYISSFIDCNNTGVARPGAGPAGAGPNAARRDNGDQQEAVYNGLVSYIIFQFKIIRVAIPFSRTKCIFIRVY